MDWTQTITIIGTLGGLIFTLFLIQRREIDGLRREIDAIHKALDEMRKDIRLIFDKIIPPYNKHD